MAWTTLKNGTTNTAVELLDNFYHVAQGDLLPLGGPDMEPTTNSFDIGDQSARWNNVYADNLNINNAYFIPSTTVKGNAIDGYYPLAGWMDDGRKVFRQISPTQAANNTGVALRDDTGNYQTSTALLVPLTASTPIEGGLGYITPTFQTATGVYMIGRAFGVCYDTSVITNRNGAQSLLAWAAYDDTTITSVLEWASGADLHIMPSYTGYAPYAFGVLTWTSEQ